MTTTITNFIMKASAVAAIAVAIVVSAGFGPTAPEASAAQPVRVFCYDGATSNALGVSVPAIGQTHVFARFKYWNGTEWVPLRKSPVNPMPQYATRGGSIQVLTYYLPGFLQENVGNAYFHVDVYSYFAGQGWVEHQAVVYQWNLIQLATPYCKMT